MTRTFMGDTMALMVWLGCRRANKRDQNAGHLLVTSREETPPVWRPSGVHRRACCDAGPERRRLGGGDADLDMAASRDAASRIESPDQDALARDHRAGPEEPRVGDSNSSIIEHGTNVQPARGAIPFSLTCYPGLYGKGTAHIANRRHGNRSAPDWRIVERRRTEIQPRFRGGAAIRLAAYSSSSGSDRERAIGGSVSRSAASIRPLGDLPEQGIRPDVPGQPDWRDRSVHRVAPRTGDFERRRARPRDSAACRDHEQRHPQGWTTGRHEDSPLGARP